MASRCTTALVDPPMAMLTVMAFSIASRVMICDGARLPTPSRPCGWPLISAIARRRESGAGMAAQPGSVMPRASATEAMVLAVPMTVQWPALRAMPPSISHHSSSREPAGAEEIEELAAVGARAEFAVAPLAAQHRSAGHHDGGDVGAGGAHQLRGRGLVAAAQQHHAIDGIGADGFLDVHRHQVAVEHGCRFHEHLAQRDGGEFEREIRRRARPRA